MIGLTNDNAKLIKEKNELSDEILAKKNLF